MSRNIKAQDQYGTVLTLPKGMKPHVKSAASANDAAEEATSMFGFFLMISDMHSVFFCLDEGKSIDHLFYLSNQALLTMP
jgi:hypothetical protein